MAMQPTAYLLVSGSNPGQAKRGRRRQSTDQDLNHGPKILLPSASPPKQRIYPKQHTPKIG